MTNLNHKSNSQSIAYHGVRPRNLSVWDTVFHLDGPWGASLAYALPIALTFTGRLAPIYLIIVSLIMLLVGNAYKVVCKYNPDGGGVYSSLRKTNRILAVIGALFLLTDYIVTAALSVSDAFYYLRIETLLQQIDLGVVSSSLTQNAAIIWNVLIILFLVAINWRGPHFSAKFAGVASVPSFFLAGLLGILALPLVPTGLAKIGSFDQRGKN